MAPSSLPLTPLEESLWTLDRARANVSAAVFTRPRTMPQYVRVFDEKIIYEYVFIFLFARETLPFRLVARTSR
jgi:hypothetical protein